MNCGFFGAGLDLIFAFNQWTEHILCSSSRLQFTFTGIWSDPLRFGRSEWFDCRMFYNVSRIFHALMLAQWRSCMHIHLIFMLAFNNLIYSHNPNQFFLVGYNRLIRQFCLYYLLITKILSIRLAIINNFVSPLIFLNP